MDLQLLEKRINQEKTQIFQLKRLIKETQPNTNLYDLYRKIGFHEGKQCLLEEILTENNVSNTKKCSVKPKNRTVAYKQCHICGNFIKMPSIYCIAHAIPCSQCGTLIYPVN